MCLVFQLDSQQLPSDALSPTRALSAGANSDITLADLRGGGRSARHPLAVKAETWQEVRYLSFARTRMWVCGTC